MATQKKEIKSGIKKVEVESKKSIKTIEIDLNESTRNTIISLIQNRDSINAQLENTILIYLDAKEVDAKNKMVDFSEDFKKILITEK